MKRTGLQSGGMNGCSGSTWTKKLILNRFGMEGDLKWIVFVTL